MNGAARPDRFPCFDGLRALAALTVALHHAAFPTGYSNNGIPIGRQGTLAHRAADALLGSPPLAGVFSHLDVGVAIFFVISGFLLYRPFVAAAIAGRGGPDTRRFFVRRAVRIFPAYWAALAVIEAWLKFPAGQNPSGVRNQIEHYLLVHVYFRRDAYQGISQAWTLAVEITFYAFVPLYALALRRLHERAAPTARLRIELLALAGVAGFAVAFRALCYWGPSAYLKELGVYWLPANLDWFAIGMVLAVLSAYGAVDDSFRTRVNALAHDVAWWLLGIAAFWLAATRTHLGLGLTRVDGWRGFAEHFLYGLTALGLLVPVALGPQDRGIVRRFLQLDAMVFVGTVSYGLYLWHQAWIGKSLAWQGRPDFTAPLLQTLAVGVGLAIAVATVSWYALERPLLRLTDRRPRPSAGAATREPVRSGIA